MLRMVARQQFSPPALAFTFCTSENHSVFLLHPHAAARLPRAASRHRWLTPGVARTFLEIIGQFDGPDRPVAAAQAPETNIMKNYREGQSTNPFPSEAPSGAGQESDDGFRDSGRPSLPDGWRRLPTGLRGARLYRIAIDGGDAHWQAEMTLNGEVQRRRFASELHARWWLAASNEPRSASSVFDGEELNAPWRADFVRGK